MRLVHNLPIQLMRDNVNESCFHWLIDSHRPPTLTGRVDSIERFTRHSAVKFEL